MRLWLWRPLAASGMNTDKKIPLRTFITLDEGLTKRLLPAWRKHALPIATAIGKAVDARKFQEARELVETLDLKVVLPRGQRDIKSFGMMALVFGATRLTDVRKTVFHGKKAPDILGDSLRHFDMTIEALNREVYRSMFRAIQAAEIADASEQRVFKAARVGQFVSFAKSVAGSAGMSSIQLTSSLHMSRLSAWGYTEEARAVGAQYYKVNEQLDGRTCPICREMDGKIFPVQPARDRLDTVLRVDDPASLSSINPWPKQDRTSLAKFKKLTPEQLISNGWETPPYHPMCRGLLVPVTSKDKIPNIQLPPTATSVRDGMMSTPIPQARVESIAARIAAGDDDLSIISSMGISAAILQEVRELL